MIQQNAGQRKTIHPLIFKERRHTIATEKKKSDTLVLELVLDVNHEFNCAQKVCKTLTTTSTPLIYSTHIHVKMTNFKSNKPIKIHINITE